MKTTTTQLGSNVKYNFGIELICILSFFVIIVVAIPLLILFWHTPLKDNTLLLLTRMSLGLIS